jgi:hypothetical protein
MASRSLDAAPPCGAPPATDTVGSQMLVARLQELRSGGRDRVAYREPGDAELEAYRSWIRDVLSVRPGDTRVPAAPPGFVLERLSRDTLLLAERPDSRRGAGAIAIRTSDAPGDAAAGLIVEAPHTFFDVGTLPIAVAFYERARSRALIINTVHRNSARANAGANEKPSPDAGTGAEVDEEDPEPSPSDVAHAARSFFLAAHEELAAAWPDAITLQVHGFGEGVRDEVPAGTSVILSAAGTPASIEGAARSLGGLLGADAVRLYPSEVRVLGGLTNVEARASAKLGARLVHVEMSRSLRDRLTRDEGLLGCFVDAFAGADFGPRGTGRSP